MFYGLDVHKEFIQVCCINAAGRKVHTARVDGTQEAIVAFGETLDSEDAVCLEATFHTWAIWAILRKHAGRVVVANPMQVKAIAHARIKTDKVDAHILAQLLRADFVPEVRMPEECVWELRQLVSHRRLLSKELVAAKNATRALINRKLLHCPYADLFGTNGRIWLLAQHMTETETFIRDNLLSVVDSLVARIADVDTKLKERAALTENARLLMTIPGVNIVIAVGLSAEIGDVTRFDSPDKLASYFGLVPRIDQSASKCHTGRITKVGRSHGRWLAIEAAQSVAMSNAPLSAAYHKIRRKRAHNVAVTALARKLIVLTWHMLTTRQPYRYAPVVRTRRKLRAVTPGWTQSKRGTKPDTIEGAYAEAGLPALRPATPGERRTSLASLRVVGRARAGKARSKTVKHQADIKSASTKKASAKKTARARVNAL